MSNKEQFLSIKIDPVKPFLFRATISIPEQYVNNIYESAALAQQQQAAIYGFNKGTAPLNYIKEFYKNNLTKHVQEFLFKHVVIDYLYMQLAEQKISVASEPRLAQVTVNEQGDTNFIFELSITSPIEFQEWKHFPFKAPKRKNYKDIDRQVELFIAEEEALAQQYQNNAIIPGDWVCFDIFIANNDRKPLLGDYHQTAWLKIGIEEADVPFQELFCGKKTGDTFFTTSSCIQSYYSSQLSTHYMFGIAIKDILEHYFFSFEHFKHHFRLKNSKEINQKLIEIFSYRNDISQRRSMVEEAFKVLINHHNIQVPPALILRQQKLVLENVQNNPDYQVYKMERNFKETIEHLATKQAKEIILIDQLAFKENIKVSNQDIKGFLNLTNRPRTKEFIYFAPPPSKIEGQEIPLPIEVIKKNCLREKALNHVIYHFTKK